MPHPRRLAEPLAHPWFAALLLAAAAPGVLAAGPGALALAAAPLGLFALALDVRGRLARLALPALAAGGLALGLLAGLDHLALDPLGDAGAYRAAALRLNAGDPLYPADQDLAGNRAYLYPPLLAVAWRPLALLPEPVALALWEGLLLAASAFLVRRLLRALGPRRGLLALGLLAPGFCWSLAIGQASILVAAALALASPAGVALAGALKLTPLTLGLHWAGRGDRRALARLALATGALALLSLVLEPGGTLTYPAALLRFGIAGTATLALGGGEGPLFAAYAALLLAASLAAARRPHGWPLAVAASLLVSPRLFAYSWVALAPMLLGPEPDASPARPLDRGA